MCEMCPETIDAGRVFVPERLVWNFLSCKTKTIIKNNFSYSVTVFGLKTTHFKFKPSMQRLIISHHKLLN